MKNAKIIGVGNGNNRSLEPFVANYRKLYNGKCVVILQKQDNHSKAFLKATLSETKITQSITF
ncbi:hypothetical protein [Aquimarina algiphila]|uniref:hypothetical protein n=1 Tax=Aquimarina algiphila TaxID=2047982 RepID=UPI001FCAE93A|nr:hypothetical protein [Aquimarina algiphila]